MKISMKSAVLTACIAVTLGWLTGCAAPAPKRMADVQLPPPPTEQEAMQKISAYLESALFDPYSAKVSCTHVPHPSWIWAGTGTDIRYGYLSLCNINAKNKLGGYTGAKRYVFRIKGSEFEHHEYVVNSGVVKN